MELRRFTLNKLVRDKVYESIREGAENVNYRLLDHESYINALKQKLSEEVTEVIHADNNEELIAELADLLEVYLALVEAMGIDFADIESARNNKLEGSGGFDAKAYIEDVTLPADHPIARYYLKFPNKYPEVANEE